MYLQWFLDFGKTHSAPFWKMFSPRGHLIGVLRYVKNAIQRKRKGAHWDYNTPLTLFICDLSGRIKCCNILRHGNVTLSMMTGCSSCIPIRNSRITETQWNNRVNYIKYIGHIRSLSPWVYSQTLQMTDSFCELSSFLDCLEHGNLK
jgi:hypothetical protein